MSSVFILVEQILKENKVSKMSGISPRDSDKELIIQYLLMRGAGLSEKQLHIIRDVSFESITRARRKLQEQGKYEASTEVSRQRRVKSQIVQQTAPKAKPEALQQSIDNIRRPLPWGN